MFFDEAAIYVKAGDGGNGCVSFRREKYVPKGGPAGGNGGKGGDVILVISKTKNTLIELASISRYVAENGGPGEGSNRTGRNGDDLIINLPIGTIVKDVETGCILKDFTDADDSLIIVKGGKGGRGNKRFATSTNQTPRYAEDGIPGGERRIKLELKLIADAGLIGLPNAGKSTLLSKLSSVNPKIGAYPFTTRYPQLGTVDLNDYTRFIVADIPGLIEGAHNGTGLGDEFLRHIERTKILVHLVDIAPVDGSDPVESYFTIRNELKMFNEKLCEKTEIIVANKIDLLDESSSDQKIKELEDKLGKKIHPISAATGKNISLLINVISKQLLVINDQQE
ncbi:MAG: GTPase ObgE [Candidatus Anammoxibacter sp.]